MFDPVKLEWEGKQYVIPPDQVLKCIAKVEDVVTATELAMIYQRPSSMPYAKVSMAYGIFLRYAGAKVTDWEVWTEFADPKKGAKAAEALNVLFQSMVPPQLEQAKVDGKSDPIKAPAKGSPSVSSKNSTKHVSGMAG